jgi:hypothetical protein
MWEKKMFTRGDWGTLLSAGQMGVPGPQQLDYSKNETEILSIARTIANTVPPKVVKFGTLQLTINPPAGASPSEIGDDVMNRFRSAYPDVMGEEDAADARANYVDAPSE